MKIKIAKVLALGLMTFSHLGLAASETINMSFTTDKQPEKSIGTIIAKDTPYGLLLTPELSQLAPGLHGFHVHENTSCSNNGMAAGGHLDPRKTLKHLGPYNPKGHLGDLPPLYVDTTGHASLPVLAPRLKVRNLRGHSLMVHEGSDNFSDKPILGGGGPRMACGVIHKKK
jgi:superoxide dismutase, Cu-Zn family